MAVRRVPVVATAVVALAVAAMVALGFWQLDRRRQKLALLDTYAANQRLPAIALPPRPDDRLLFRRVVATCRDPGPWRRESGRSADGGSGWRAIAACSLAGGDGVLVQMGVGADPLHAPTWRGGPVTGYLSHAPQHRALIATVFAPAPPEPMLVADTPLPGLKPNPPADLAAVPNNHLAYAVQWFVFAGLAVLIYALALRRRAAVVPPRPHG